MMLMYILSIQNLYLTDTIVRFFLLKDIANLSTSLISWIVVECLRRKVSCVCLMIGATRLFR